MYRSDTSLDPCTLDLPPLVLVVDDDPMICLLAEETLRQAGFRVHPVGSCRACLEALDHLSPAVVLLDLTLPDGDGLSLCAQVQQTGSEGPIPIAVMLASQDTDEKVQLATQLGIYDVIPKPVNWNLLAPRVRNLVRLRELQLSQLRTQQQQECLTELIEFSSQQLTLEGFLQKLLERVLALPWPGLAGCGAVFLADGQHQCLRLAAQLGLTSAFRRFCTQIAYGECCCGGAAKERQMTFRLAKDKEGMITCAVGPDYDHFHVPLYADDTLLGVMVLYLRPGHGWDGRQQDFLQTLGKVMGGLVARKRAEQHLSLAASVFEGSLEAVVILDADLKILEVNKVFSDLTGFAAAEIRGQNIHLLQLSLAETKEQENQCDTLCLLIKQQLDTQGHWQGEVWVKHRDGTRFLGWLQVGRAQEGGRGAYVMVIADITERKRQVDFIHRLAFYDQLTGLCNRSLLMDRLTLACRQIKRKKSSIAILFFDLDGFKAVNDSLGHDKGDQLLSEVAKRIHGAIREEDTAARLGGDEFVLLLTGLDSCYETAKQQAAQIAEKVSAALRQTVDLDGSEVEISTSIGIALAPEDSREPEELLILADLAMYAAKQQGGARHCSFRPEMGKGRVRRLNLEGKLRLAFEQEKLAVYLQPRLRVQDQRLVGAEALIRWWDEESGNWIPPREFLPVVEQMGLSDALDAWVMERIGQIHRQWHGQGLCGGLHQIAFNVSPRRFHRSGYVKKTCDLLRRSDIADCCQPEFEVSEETLMCNPDESVRIIAALKASGVRFSVDDFGTGYSNLACLKRFQLDLLKIDESLVKKCLVEPDSAAVVRAIVALAEELEMEVVAEGVETSAQLALLKRWQCHYFQGYLSAPALSPEEFEALLLNTAEE